MLNMCSPKCNASWGMPKAKREQATFIPLYKLLGFFACSFVKSPSNVAHYCICARPKINDITVMNSSRSRVWIWTAPRWLTTFSCVRRFYHLRQKGNEPSRQTWMQDHVKEQAAYPHACLVAGSTFVQSVHSGSVIIPTTSACMRWKNQHLSEATEKCNKSPRQRARNKSEPLPTAGSLLQPAEETMIL